MPPLFHPDWPRRRLAGQLIYFLSWVACTFIGAFVLHPDPHLHGTHTQLGLPPCPSVVFFGRPCPGCGLTTSWTNLLHGHFGAAMACHPMGPLLYAAFTLTAGLAIYGWVKGMKVESVERPYSTAITAFIAVFLMFGFFRWATTRYADWPQVAAQYGVGIAR